MVGISLRESAYETLKEQILSAQRAPGETLNEKEVAASLGVSKTPVREAISRLSAEGFVEVYPRQGTIVRHIQVRDIKNVLLVRSLVEPEAAYQAALRATPEDVEQLGTLDDEQIATPEGAWPDLRQHARFHVAVAEVGRVPQLTAIVATVHDQVRWFLASHAREGGAPFPMRLHETLLEAIARGDADEARRVSEESVRTSRANLLRNLIDD